MNSTTSDKQIQGPAIIMSHEGAQIFFDFIAKIMGAPPLEIGGPDDMAKEVGRFVDGWKKHSAAQEPQEPIKPKYTKRDFEGEFEAIESIMRDNGEMPLRKIWTGMRNFDYWNVEYRQATQDITRLMKKYPAIKKAESGRGLYWFNEWEGVHNDQT